MRPLRDALALSLALGLVGCGGAPDPQTGRIPSGAPSRPYDANGDGAPDGTQYDIDGDGTFDAVDVDGDGVLDGGDFDGDGVVTLFTRLATGAALPTPERLALLPEDIDPDFEAQLEDADKADGAGVVTQPSIDLRGSMPRPGQQGQLGSCAAWTNAAIATAARASRVGADPNQAWASPQFLYARQIKAAGDAKCNEGTWIEDGLATLVVEGATPLSILPYSDMTCAIDPAAQDADAYRIGGFEVLQPWTRDKAREVLSKGNPIAFAVTLPPNFGNLAGPDGKQVFKSAAGQLGGPHGGGHAMAMVGFDDARGAYLVQNSWGTDWGDGGYVWWDYADLEAREGLYGFAVHTFKTPPPPLMTITEPMLQVTLLAGIAVRQKTGDRLIAHVALNGPVFITGVALDDQPADAREQYLGAGNIAARANGPLAAGEHKLTVTGRIAAGLTGNQARTQGPQFTRTIAITTTDPVPDPDGRI